MAREIGLPTRRGRTVSLEQGAAPGSARCPACGEPLFVWVEAQGYGTREDQLIDRCENCGLAVPRDAVPSPDHAVDALLFGREESGSGVAIRADNAASLQAWLGAENWAALRIPTKRVAPGGAPSRNGIKPTPRAIRLLLARRGLEVRRVRHLIRPGMASMWQTLLNLLTFHRDFASEAASGRLRPGTGRGLAAFWVDAVVTVLAAIPTAIIAVVLETGAVLARRGGAIEVHADRLPSTD
ncbi:MAG: hypothetical protein WB771_09000 [Solirubrobacterales bacterium]